MFLNISSRSEVGASAIFQFSLLGIEQTTLHMLDECSTIEQHTHLTEVGLHSGSQVLELQAWATKQGTLSLPLNIIL